MTPPAEPRKVVIVTGASQGIGAGIAHGFLGLGYRVVATLRSIPLRTRLTCTPSKATSRKPRPLSASFAKRSTATGESTR